MKNILSCDQRDRLYHDHGDNERRTWMVIGLTAVVMVIEILAGWWFGSMALLADGWHMASHASALGITALAYAFARRHANNPRFSFGTGKVGVLAGFASALLLAGIALLMAVESTQRFFAPVPIAFNEAISVAVLGLLVNLLSAFILGHEGDSDHKGHAHHHDHNIRAAYLHVLADALTSVTAIVALLTGKYLNWVWMDPLMGVVGALVISRWAVSLIRETSRTLLDVTPHDHLASEIRQAVETIRKTQILDFHLWRIGSAGFGTILSVSAPAAVSINDYKEKLRPFKQLCHVTIEIQSPRP